VGVPVSTSQAIIGAVLAIGFVKGVQTINFGMLAKIVGAWVLTPVVGLLFSHLIYFILHLQFTH
jgi:PiT family inorganic phosphate transporter